MNEWMREQMSKWMNEWPNACIIIATGKQQQKCSFLGRFCFTLFQTQWKM